MVLAQGARIHLKHTVSAREWTVRGPARFLPCVRGEEDIILAQGALGTEIGAGARPGAQVLIGTPFGSVRYADAHSEVWVSPGELRVDVKAGEAWLDSASDAAGSETHARPGAPVRRGRSARFDAAAALRACAAAARASEDRARALLELGARALGERARSHVRAREQARSRCAAAAAAAAQQSSGENLATSLGEIERHGERWRRIPDSSG